MVVTPSYDKKKENSLRANQYLDKHWKRSRNIHYEKSIKANLRLNGKNKTFCFTVTQTMEHCTGKIFTKYPIKKEASVNRR